VKIGLSKEELHHLRRVRRMVPGETCVAINGRGEEVSACLAEDGSLALQGSVRREPPAARGVALAPALTRTEGFEDAMERAIELGVTAIFPLLTTNTVVRLDERKKQARVERWQRLAVERLKQCERLHLPQIAAPQTLDQFLGGEDCREYRLILLAERAAALPPFRTVVDGMTDAVCLLTGPEGGWTSREILSVRAAMGVEASLGPAILRSETAVLAALATVLAS